VEGEVHTRKWAASLNVVLIVSFAIATSAKISPAQSSRETPVPAIDKSWPNGILNLVVIDESWPDVNLNVVVLDKLGAPQTVDEQEFHLFEDGRERPLQFRGSPGSPVSLALIIDSSGSMYGRTGSIAAVVNAIVKDLPRGSEVMAVSFNQSAHLDLEFAPATQADLSFLGQLDNRGVTALYDAIVVTEKYFSANARCARRAVVLLSDGEDNSSRSKLSDATHSLQWPGAPAFYSFVLPDTEVSGVGTGHDRAAMEGLARAAGGLALTPKQNEFMPAITRLTDAIRNQMVVQFTAADPARDGNAHKIELRLPDKNLQIHSLHQYFAPTK
jgi:Ca-activated chloride channel family protein